MSNGNGPPVATVISTLIVLCGDSVDTVAQVVLESDDPRIARAEQLHFEYRAAESFEVFESVVEAEPTNYEALWKTAMEAVVMGLLAEDKEAGNEWFIRGEEYAGRAIEIEPDGIEGLYWLLSAKGLRAVQTNPTDGSRLGFEVYHLAHRVLEMDSAHAGAYHALGVLNYEIQKLNRVERFVARRILGNRLVPLTSWEDAERYFEKAIELEPDFILYHLDLGKMHIKRKQMELARQALGRVLALQPVHPPDVRFQETAERLLATLN